MMMSMNDDKGSKVLFCQKQTRYNIKHKPNYGECNTQQQTVAGSTRIIMS